MPGRQPRRRLSPEQRYAQLLECALRVFARRGLGRSAHAEIAREAGVSVSTVFVYFPSRRALVRAVLSEVERFYAEMAESHHRDTSSAAKVILKHTEAFARSVETHPDHARVWLDWSTAIRDDVWPLYLNFQERVVRRIEATIRRGKRAGAVRSDVAPHEAALLIVGSAHMIAQMKFAGASAPRLHRFLVRLVESTLGTESSAAGEERSLLGEPAESEAPRRTLHADS
jgi:TetR/AcrR family hemagglutinin/protease transcriptional regulator